MFDILFAGKVGTGFLCSVLYFSSRMASAQANHEKAPICAEFVKLMREVFGADQVTVLYVKEGDLEIGEPMK